MILMIAMVKIFSYALECQPTDCGAPRVVTGGSGRLSVGQAIWRGAKNWFATEGAQPDGPYFVLWERDGHVGCEDDVGRRLVFPGAEVFSHDV